MNRIALSLAALATVLIGGVASAEVPAVIVQEKGSFGISSHVDYGQVYYSCDSVEAAAKDLLYAFGAVEVSVHCSGGLDNGVIIGDAFLSVEFTHPVTAKSTDATHSARYVTTELKGRESSSGVTKGHACHLMREIFRNTAESFDLQNLHADFRCSSSFSRSYVIHVDALKL